MKKLMLPVSVLMFTAVLSAALPGERPGESKHKLQWIDSSPMPLGRVYPEKHKDIPALRAVVFMYTRAQDSDRTFAMLENLRRRYQGKVLISAITPDQVKDARAIRQKHPDSRIRLAVDLSRKLTPEFMNNTIMLFPMAFLLDADGVVLWRGEAVDLPEVIERQSAGKLDLQMVKTCDPLIYKMQQAMRDGNLFKARDAALTVLENDPVNPSALRMLIFASESLGDVNPAWNALNRATGKNPLPRLYFTALDLMMRHEHLRGKLPGVIVSFGKRPYTPEIRCAFIDALLNNFQFESAAVLGAKDILAGTPMAMNAAPLQMGQLLAVRARLNYALGNLALAEADMSEAVEFLRKSTEKEFLKQMEKQLKFFRELLKSAGGNAR